MSQKRIEELSKKIKEIRSEIKVERSKIADQKRKMETRKKIVLGGQLLALAGSNQQANDVLRAALSRLTASERELFADFEPPPVSPARA